MGKIVSIATHPKFRDVSALRRFLNGEVMDHRGAMDSKDLKMLSDLQEWAAGLAALPNEQVPTRRVEDRHPYRDFKTIAVRSDFKYMHYEGPTDDA